MTANPTPLGETYLISPCGGAPVAQLEDGSWSCWRHCASPACPDLGDSECATLYNALLGHPTAQEPLARRSPLWGVKAAGVPPRGLSPRLSRLHHILNVVSPDL